MSWFYEICSTDNSVLKRDAVLAGGPAFESPRGPASRHNSEET